MASAASRPASALASPPAIGVDNKPLPDCFPDSFLPIILLRKVTDGRIDPEQSWFGTREWQQREREADEDLAAGRVTRFEGDEEELRRQLEAGCL